MTTTMMMVSHFKGEFKLGILIFVKIKMSVGLVDKFSQTYRRGTCLFSDSIYSDVYQVTDDNDRILVEKIIKSGELDIIYNEIRSLGWIHPNIIRYHEVRFYFDYDTPRASCIMDLGRPLQDCLASWLDLRQLIVQLLEALCFIESQGWVYGDIKIENLVIVEGQLKLIDFGFMWRIGERDIVTQTFSDLGGHLLQEIRVKDIDYTKISSSPYHNAMFALGATIFNILHRNQSRATTRVRSPWGVPQFVYDLHDDPQDWMIRNFKFIDEDVDQWYQLVLSLLGPHALRPKTFAEVRQRSLFILYPPQPGQVVATPIVPFQVTADPALVRKSLRYIYHLVTYHGLDASTLETSLHLFINYFDGDISCMRASSLACLTVGAALCQNETFQVANVIHEYGFKIQLTNYLSQIERLTFITAGMPIILRHHGWGDYKYATWIHLIHHYDQWNQIESPILQILSSSKELRALLQNLGWPLVVGYRFLVKDHIVTIKKRHVLLRGKSGAPTGSL
jgi:hypothetical protein